jgi:hypothetical protein
MLWVSATMDNSRLIIIHDGTHPKHQRLLSMVALTQNTNDYYPWWHSPKTPTTIIHGGTHPKHQQLLSMVALTQNTND